MRRVSRVFKGETKLIDLMAKQNRALSLDSTELVRRQNLIQALSLLSESLSDLLRIFVLDEQKQFPDKSYGIYALNLYCDGE